MSLTTRVSDLPFLGYAEIKILKITSKWTFILLNEKNYRVPKRNGLKNFSDYYIRGQRLIVYKKRRYNGEMDLFIHKRLETDEVWIEQKPQIDKKLAKSRINKECEELMDSIRRDNETN